jgi:uncharacterized membrane protein YsdA (DUF1294 family)
MTRFGWTVLLAAGIGALGIATGLGILGLSSLRALLAGLNLATLLAYGYDKLLARSGMQRVPELALHLLSVCGGTVGAFAGQILFRHKTRDARFRLIFFAIAAGQILLLLLLNTR